MQTQMTLKTLWAIVVGVLSATLVSARGTTTSTLKTTGRKLVFASPSSYGARRQERADVDISSINSRSSATRRWNARLSRHGAEGDKGYASVGIIPPRGAEALNGMDLEDGDNVLRAAYERSYKGELILINANAGGTTTARNAVASARAVGIEHFLLYTESEVTCLRIMASRQNHTAISIARGRLT